VACCESGIIHIVLLISQKDYVLYKRRINILCARHAVVTFGNCGFKENKIGSPLQTCGDKIAVFHLRTCAFCNTLHRQGDLHYYGEKGT